MVVEPLLQYLDGLLGEVAAPLARRRRVGARPVRPVVAARGVLLRRRVLVRRRAGVTLALANCKEVQEGCMKGSVAAAGNVTSGRKSVILVIKADFEEEFSVFSYVEIFSPSGRLMH